MLRGLLIALGIVVGVWLVAILVLVVLGRRSQARELAKLLPNLIILFQGLLGDPRVPRSSKAWLGFALALVPVADRPDPGVHPRRRSAG